MAINIDPARLERLLSPDTHLVPGKGAGIIESWFNACVMQAVDWLAGGDGSSDMPQCADPVIGGFCRRLNDAEVFEGWRDELKRFAPKIVGTRGSPGLTRKRAYIAADWAVRTIAPMALQGVWPAYAAALRALPEIVDEATARAAREACRKVAIVGAAASYAAGAADAASYAAADAAASAAAAAASYAAAYAAGAANAAAVRSAPSQLGRGVGLAPADDRRTGARVKPRRKQATLFDAVDAADREARSWRCSYNGGSHAHILNPKGRVCWFCSMYLSDSPGYAWGRGYWVTRDRLVSRISRRRSRWFIVLTGVLSEIRRRRASLPNLAWPQQADRELLGDPEC